MQKRSYFFQLLFCVGIAFSMLAQAETSSPNVIFFLADDVRWDRLGCAGHPHLKTPVIDELAAEGVRFSNMFVSTAICAASRATIFTGMYERTHGYTFGTPPISEKHWRDSYPAQLKANGYKTGFTGKFGVSMENGGQDKIFDFFKPVNRNPYMHKMPDGSLRHETEIDGDNAVEFLKSCSKDQPFCLSVSFNAAHAEDRDKRPGIGHYPWPKSVNGLYEDVVFTAPLLSDPAIFEAHPQFMKESMNRDRWFWRWDTPEKYQTNLRAYYRMISGFDTTIGRVLENLKELGMAENTIIIFAGDNGYYEGQRGFAGKWSHYEESLRVPLIVYDPRAKKSLRGKVAEEMVLNEDVASTILNYAGVTIPESHQGRSLVPLMRGESPSDWRKDTFCEHLMDNPDIPKWEGVRGSRYVYARYFQQEPVFEYLHDLKEDPDQLKNFAADPAMRDVLAKMRARTDELRAEYGGPFDPERSKKWKAQQIANKKEKAEARAKAKAKKKAELKNKAK